MAFDVDHLVKFSAEAISGFASEHSDETFYGFAIDSGMLCLNSEEAFANTLKDYAAKFPDKYTPKSERAAALRMSTGDWEYQGFIYLDDCPGFDREAYGEHYNAGFESSDGDTETSNSTPYAIAMDQLLARLNEIDAFSQLRRTSDFFTIRVEHEF